MTYKTKYHRDGTATVWDVYRQSWWRGAWFSDAVFASLPSGERSRLLRHLRDGNANNCEALNG